MSIFLCNNCQLMIDGDFDGCNEDPSDHTQMLCDQCLEELEEFYNAPDRFSEDPQEEIKGDPMDNLKGLSETLKMLSIVSQLTPVIEDDLTNTLNDYTGESKDDNQET